MENRNIIKEWETSGLLNEITEEYKYSLSLKLSEAKNFLIERGANDEVETLVFPMLVRYFKVNKHFNTIEVLKQFIEDFKKKDFERDFILDFVDKNTTKHKLIQYFKSRLLTYEFLGHNLDGHYDFELKNERGNRCVNVVFKTEKDCFKITSDINGGISFEISEKEFNELYELYYYRKQLCKKNKDINEREFFNKVISYNVVIKNNEETEILKKYEIIPAFKVGKQEIDFYGEYEECLKWIKNEQKVDLSK